MTEFTTSQTAQQLALNNELFVKQLDAALMNANLPPNTLREMILEVNKSLECDQACQEQRRIDKLKTDWTNAKNVAIKSEQNREQAIKTFTQIANHIFLRLLKHPLKRKILLPKIFVVD